MFTTGLVEGSLMAGADELRRSLFHDTRQPRSVQRRENAATPSFCPQHENLVAAEIHGHGFSKRNAGLRTDQHGLGFLAGLVGKRNCRKRNPSVPMPNSIPNPMTAWLRKRRRPTSS